MERSPESLAARGTHWRRSGRGIRRLSSCRKQDPPLARSLAGTVADCRRALHSNSAVFGTADRSPHRKLARRRGCQRNMIGVVKSVIMKKKKGPHAERAAQFSGRKSPKDLRDPHDGGCRACPAACLYDRAMNKWLMAAAGLGSSWQSARKRRAAGLANKGCHMCEQCGRR